MMGKEIRKAVERVASGVSESGTIHALLSEVKLGDPDELDRLYGGDFSASGKLSFSAHSDAELDNVPAFIRQRLVHHGYTHSKSRTRLDSDLYVYEHPDGHQVRIATDGTNFNWVHFSQGIPTHTLNSHTSGMDLVNHLDTFHS